MASLPLKGKLVVSLEQAVAAPYCSSRLADAGARVIKIERAEGDFARGYDSAVHGESAYFVWLNRGKESLVLNIKNKDDASLLQTIISKSDVFIQNLAPGAAARSGLESRVLRSRYPRLITVDISGYGQSDEYAEMKAYDLLIQAETGLCSVTGRPEGPGRVGVSACDIACGMYAYMAVLEAIIDREHTGKGTSIKTSLFEGMADWMNVPLLTYDYAGKIPNRVGLNHPSIAPYGAYPTADKSEVLISIQNEREWTRFCLEVLERSNMIEDQRFCNNELRCKNRKALNKILNKVFGSTSRTVLLEKLRCAGIAFGEVNDVEGLSHHSALRRVEVDSPTGKVSMVAPPVTMDETPRVLGPIPAIGQHSEEIRREFSV